MNPTSPGPRTLDQFGTPHGDFMPDVAEFDRMFRAVEMTQVPQVPKDVRMRIQTARNLRVYAGSCNAPIIGWAAYGTTIHPFPVTPGLPAAGTYAVTETRFTSGFLSLAELRRVTSLCGFIQSNGSGFGICKSCRFGGLGAVTQ